MTLTTKPDNDSERESYDWLRTVMWMLIIILGAVTYHLLVMLYKAT